MQTWIHIQDGKHILDSCRDYTDGDWKPKNNCVEYGLYNEFAQESSKLNHLSYHMDHIVTI